MPRAGAAPVPPSCPAPGGGWNGPWLPSSIPWGTPDNPSSWPTGSCQPGGDLTKRPKATALILCGRMAGLGTSKEMPGSDSQNWFLLWTGWHEMAWHGMAWHGMGWDMIERSWVWAFWSVIQDWTLPHTSSKSFPHRCAKFDQQS